MAVVVFIEERSDYLSDDDYYCNNYFIPTSYSVDAERALVGGVFDYYDTDCSEMSLIEFQTFVEFDGKNLTMELIVSMAQHNDAMIELDRHDDLQIVLMSYHVKEFYQGEDFYQVMTVREVKEFLNKTRY